MEEKEKERYTNRMSIERKSTCVKCKKQGYQDEGFGLVAIGDVISMYCHDCMKELGLGVDAYSFFKSKDHG